MKEYMTRRDEANEAIRLAHESFTGDNLKDRIKYIDNFYPFGDRSHHPYKVWLEIRREYLTTYGYNPKNAKKQPTTQDLQDIWNKPLRGKR